MKGRLPFLPYENLKGGNFNDKECKILNGSVYGNGYLLLSIAIIVVVGIILKKKDLL